MSTDESSTPPKPQSPPAMQGAQASVDQAPTSAGAEPARTHDAPASASAKPAPTHGTAQTIPVSGKRPLGIAAIVTLLVTGVSYVAGDYAATGVGLAFLGITAWLVLQHDTRTVLHHGLALGGVFEPGPIRWQVALGSLLRSCAWALAIALIVFPPFAIGFQVFWHLRIPFQWKLVGIGTDDVLGQLLVVALPEEAFYRGYLMTALDDAWGTPWKIGGARVGWGLVVSCAVFAVGHLLTEPNPGRLAVFFPALVFGWLRARTKSVGAGTVLHAMCNLFASALGQGYGFGRP